MVPTTSTTASVVSRRFVFRDDFQEAVQAQIKSELTRWMTCAVCLDMRSDFIVVCAANGHSYCQTCACILVRNGVPCPLCRSPLAKIVRDGSRRQIIVELKQQFLGWIQQYLTRHASAPVDARDQYGKWYEAEVSFHKDGGLLLHYIGWGPSFDELLEKADLETWWTHRVLPRGAMTTTTSWLSTVREATELEVLLHKYRGGRKWFLAEIEWLPEHRRFAWVKVRHPEKGLTRLKIKLHLEHVAPLGFHTPHGCKNECTKKV